MLELIRVEPKVVAAVKIKTIDLMEVNKPSSFDLEKEPMEIVTNEQFDVSTHVKDIPMETITAQETSVGKHRVYFRIR